MAWEIVEQTEKVCGMEIPVFVKHVKGFPKQKVIGKGNRAVKVDDGYGRLKFPCLRMLVRNGNSVQVIRWSNFHRKPYGENCGTWRWVYREKTDTQGEDASDPMYSLLRWSDFLAKRVGEEMALEILALFDDRIRELMGIEQRESLMVA